jgi:ribonuclease BN (tRNA processing enzyme)
MQGRYAAVATLLLSAAACAQTAPHNQFITLGTSAGPNAQANRSQPANALVVSEDLYLVDAGSGAVGQLTKAGFNLLEVDGLFISHNHFDHTAGVLAVLALRTQLQSRNTLRIFGPPGTQTFIDGLLAGMAPAMEAATGMPGLSWRAAVEVREVTHGSAIEFDNMTVHVAENTHFAIPDESGLPEKAKSLAFRFDLENRSIVYTGDTGPSTAVEELARGADLLISEMMDIDTVMAEIRHDPNIPQEVHAGIEWHLRAHHVLPRQVGELASNAGVTKVVVTHVSPNVSSDAMANRYLDEIGEAFDGEAVIANDLDRF